MTSFWSHRWSPLVMTSTPAEKISAGDFRGDAGAAGGVLAVGDDEIERVLFAQFGQKVFDRVRPGWPTMSPMKSSFTGEI